MPHVLFQNLSTDVKHIYIKNLRGVFHGFKNLYQGGGGSQSAC